MVRVNMAMHPMMIHDSPLKDRVDLNKKFVDGVAVSIAARHRVAFATHNASRRAQFMV